MKLTIGVILLNIIFTFTLSNLFVINLIFPAIKIILSEMKGEKLNRKGFRFNDNYNKDITHEHPKNK